MNDERLFALLAAHAGSADVDPAFEDRLYAHLQTELGRSRRSNRPTLLLVAALLAILVVSAAIAIGSGVIDLPWIVDESPSPGPSAAAPSEPLEPSPSVVTQVPTWTTTGSMVEARTGHTATRLQDGRVLVAGGTGPPTSESIASILASAELYDPGTGQWIATGSMLGIRTGHTATLLPDGRVLVAGGNSSSDGDGGPLATAELYDPTSGTWTATGSMIGTGSGRTATLLETGNVLLAGGSSINFEPTASAEVYNPTTEAWTATGTMLDPRDRATATLLLDGTVLVTGGGVATAELYDPNAEAWTETGSMAEARSDHTGVVLPDGSVLVAGGFHIAGAGDCCASATAEVYDPSSGAWTITGAMGEFRWGHTATLLADSTVLVAGSWVNSNESLASGELYEPGSESWTPGGTMEVGRGGHTATRLLDGRVLVAGGISDAFSQPPLNAAELYDPSGGN